VSVPATQADWAARAGAISADGAVGLVHGHATHHVAVETSLGRIYGRDDWVAALVAERAGLAGRETPHSVAWVGTSTPGRAVVIEMDWPVSHVELSPTFGPPMGGSAVLSSTMIGLVEGDRIHRAWRFVDHASACRSLGIDLDARATRLAAGAPRRGGVPWEFGEVRPGLGQTAPPTTVPPPPGLSAALAAPCTALQAAWNARRFDVVTSLYATGATSVSGSEPVEPGSARHPWARILAACPSAVLFLEQAVCDTDSGSAGDSRVALLWRWIGAHAGSGLGPPCGHRLHVRGITVLHLREALITRERVMWDELGVRRDALVRMLPDVTRP
jgi:hypothetical protein